MFGGSWGSALALAYAETHPARVRAMLLRGVFTVRRSELLWFYQDGASRIFPDAFEPFQRFIPAVERGDMISAYYRRLTCGDRAIELEAARVGRAAPSAAARRNPERHPRARRSCGAPGSA